MENWLKAGAIGLLFYGLAAILHVSMYALLALVVLFGFHTLMELKDIKKMIRGKSK